MLLRFTELSAVTALLLLVAAARLPHARAVLYSAVALQMVGVTLAFFARRGITHHIEHLTDLAEHDPATNCLNRRGFGRVLEELVGPDGREVSMLALDLDHFKRINDRYGHHVGDIVLKEVSRILIDTTSADGCVARLGGEEFGVVLPDADPETAGVMAEKLVCRLRALELPVLRNGESLTMSVGVATERLHTPRDCAALLARADEALYIAKRGGRDRALLWAPGVRSFATPAVSRAITDPGTDGLIRDHSRPMGDRRTVDRSISVDMIDRRLSSEGDDLVP
jgi:diguanylate cyclase (GGDEF)-like protein